MDQLELKSVLTASDLIRVITFHHWATQTSDPGAEQTGEGKGGGLSCRSSYSQLILGNTPLSVGRQYTATSLLLT